MNRFFLPTAAVLLLLLTCASIAQDLPDKIRGYKVYQAKVKVTASVEKTVVSASGDEAAVIVAPPRLVEVGLSGITFETEAEIGPAPQSGKVDFITFRDIRVNGVAVEIEEYSHPLEVKKGVAIKLPKPVRGFVSSLSVAKAVYKELVESKPTWNVTGTVFVFGKFKKYGLKFKRVVPVKVDLNVKNPLT